MSDSKADLLEKIKSEIQQAAKKSSRDAKDIKLIAVSKTKPWEDILTFHKLGVSDFGENYIQEALAKIKESKKLKAQIQWHFIGKLQTNKAKFIPENFTLFHGLDSLPLAEKINRACENSQKITTCLVEVNIDEESSKGGIFAHKIPDFLASIASLHSIKVTGFMCIPEPKNGRDPREPFSKLRTLLEKTNSLGCYPEKLKELSMGMSQDFVPAILEGATMVRIGTKLFGERK